MSGQHAALEASFCDGLRHMSLPSTCLTFISLTSPEVTAFMEMIFLDPTTRVPHCVHILPNTIGLSIRTKETVSPDYWVPETQVSHHPVVRYDPTPPLSVSPDHFSVSLHENLKVGLKEKERALLVRRSASACRGRRRYFKLNQGINTL